MLWWGAGWKYVIVVNYTTLLHFSLKISQNISTWLMVKILWDTLYYDFNKEREPIRDQEREFVLIVNPLMLKPHYWSSFYTLSCLQSLILFVFLKNLLSRNQNKTFSKILKINWIWNNKYWHQKIQLAFIFLLAIEIVHSGIDRFHIVPPIFFVPSAVLCVRSLWGKGLGCGSSNRWVLVSFDERKDGPLLPDISLLPCFRHLKGNWFNYTLFSVTGFNTWSLKIVI
jgi:hypothetical protein